MAQNLKIIHNVSTDPYCNLALEEYLLLQAEPDDVILYLWQNDCTIVIGRNQNPWAECRTELLEEEGGKLARRLSGGGAVYHDMGNLNFTFICHEHNYDIQKQLRVIQNAVAQAGISATFSGRNDLLAEDRKFSGNAFYHKKGRCYHHGTILIHTDMEKLQQYLSPPKAKLASKGVSSVRSRVINLEELSPNLTCAAMRVYMAEAFSQVYGSTPEKLRLTEAEWNTVETLKEQYQSRQWVYGRTLPFSCRLEGHFSWGHLELQLQVNAGIITDLQVYTDAMDAFLADDIRNSLKGCPFQVETMAASLSKLKQSQELLQLIQEQMV